MANSRSKPVALVTGARQGLGRASSIALAEKGFDLVLMDMAEDERAAETMTAVEAKGARAVFVTADLSNLADHEPLAEKAFSAFGGLDCLLNNAGVAARPLTDIMDLTPEAFDFNLGINLRGTFFLTQAVARRMLAEESSFYRSIIFITSIAASHVSIDRSQYCVSKAGLSMAARLYAVRLASAGIHVHEVRPGFIRSDMTSSANTTKIDDYIESGGVPLRRWGRPEDVGAMTSTLASGAMPYLDGQAIYVDGAFHIPVA